MDRATFKYMVFERDNAKCVVCSEPAVDAHHLIERRLWSDGGYHVDNGVSLCEVHHKLAEQTLISVDELRELAGITRIELPETLERGHTYDKWGNIILANGQRMRGPLYYDVKLPVEVESQFTEYVKYPRTPYVFNSPGLADDQLMLVDPDELFKGKSVVITEKMDGENTTMYGDYVHARSIDSGYQAYRTWVKNFHAKIGFDIPTGFRICGENMFAKHSIKYEDLETYFYGFSVWERDVCLSWDETLLYFELLGITAVPTLAWGKWSDVRNGLSYFESLVGTSCEGFVIRNEESFNMINFQENVCKYVREGHIQTTQHWMQGGFEKNLLSKEK